MFGKIIEKKIPLGHAPKIRLPVVVEANHKGGDKIEFSSEVGKGMESSNLLDHATNAEKTGNFCKHLHAIQVQTKSGVAERLGDVEEISRAAAKVENALPARQIELDVTNAADVDRDPAVEIEIFSPIIGGAVDRIPLPNLLESDRVDRSDNTLCLERKSVTAERSERVFSCAGYSLAA